MHGALRVVGPILRCEVDELRELKCEGGEGGGGLWVGVHGGEVCFGRCRMKQECRGLGGGVIVVWEVQP